MTSSRRTHRLLELAKEIVRAESDLTVMKEEFARLAAGEGDAVPEPVPPQTADAGRPPLARTSPFTQRVQSALDGSSRPLSALDIASIIREPRAVETIRSVLSKLMARGTARRVSVGLYQSTTAGHRSAAGDDD